MIKKVLLPFLLFASLSSFADVLTLLNGNRFEGVVKKIKHCEIVFKCDGEKFDVPASDIYCLEFENPQSEILQAYLALPPDDNCLKGANDAMMYHGKGGAHFLLGALFGPFAIIGAALASPNPYNGRKTMMLSKNKDLYTDGVYLQCYKRKAKARNAGHATLGWAAWITLLVVASS